MFKRESEYVELEAQLLVVVATKCIRYKGNAQTKPRTVNVFPGPYFELARRRSLIMHTCWHFEKKNKIFLFTC